MRLSLIIPTRRGGETLEKCLQSIEKHTTDYELVIIDEEMGFAAKLNEGIRRAKGDYLIFLHDDIEVTPGWADKLAEVGAFKLGEMNDSFDDWGGFHNPAAYCLDPTQHPDYAFFCCISKEAMAQIGFFDERFANPWCQDVDMGFTIRKAGFQYECLPGKIIHRCGEGSGMPDERQIGYLNRKWGFPSC